MGEPNICHPIWWSATPIVPIQWAYFNKLDASNMKCCHPLCHVINLKCVNFLFSKNYLVLSPLAHILSFDFLVLAKSQIQYTH